eukprot:g4612.t1
MEKPTFSVKVKSKKSRKKALAKNVLGENHSKASTMEKRDFVTGIASNGCLISSKKKEIIPTGPRIIPLCKNPWDAEKEGDIHIKSSNNIKVKTEPGLSVDDVAAAALSRIANGEEIVKVKEEDSAPRVIKLARDSEGEKQNKSQLIHVVKRKRAALGSGGEKERFARDLAMRPTDPEVDGESSEYNSCAIEGIGEALLRGMGWQPGHSVGLSHGDKLEKEIEDLKPRAFRLGLGAQPKPFSKREKKLKKKENTTVGVAKGPYEGDVGKVLETVGGMLTCALDFNGVKELPQSFVVVLESADALRDFSAKHPRKKGAEVVSAIIGEEEVEVENVMVTIGGEGAEVGNTVETSTQEEVEATIVKGEDDVVENQIETITKGEDGEVEVRIATIMKGEDREVEFRIVVRVTRRRDK